MGKESVWRSSHIGGINVTYQTISNIQKWRLKQCESKSNHTPKTEYDNFNNHKALFQNTEIYWQDFIQSYKYFQRHQEHSIPTRQSLKYQKYFKSSKLVAPQDHHHRNNNGYNPWDCKRKLNQLLPPCRSYANVLDSMF